MNARWPTHWRVHYGVSRPPNQLEDGQRRVSRGLCYLACKSSPLLAGNHLASRSVVEHVRLCSCKIIHRNLYCGRKTKWNLCGSRVCRVKHCHGREILYFFRYEPVVLVPIDTWSNLEFSAAIESLIRGSILSSSTMTTSSFPFVSSEFLPHLFENKAHIDKFISRCSPEPPGVSCLLIHDLRILG
jgi:hypothetical protein